MLWSSHTSFLATRCQKAVHAVLPRPLGAPHEITGARQFAMVTQSHIHTRARTHGCDFTHNQDSSRGKKTRQVPSSEPWQRDKENGMANHGNIDVFGLVALAPNIAHCLASAQAGCGLHVDPQKLRLAPPPPSHFKSSSVIYLPDISSTES